MTKAQERTYQEAVARAQSYKTTQRAYSIRYGR